MGANYAFDGLGRLEKQLSAMIERQFPAEFKQMVINIAYELQGQAKQNTPRRTGRLQDSWAVGEIKRQGDAYVIEVYTNVDYAEPVEYGHRARGSGFIPGYHMMELSLETVAERLPAYLRTWLDGFLESHGL